MGKRGTLAFLGGDARFLYMAQAMSDFGWETLVWGHSETERTDPSAFPCRFLSDWHDAVGADGIILPLPATKDGVRIFAEDPERFSLRFDALLSALPAGARLYGGKLPETWVDPARRAGISLNDYFDSEPLQLCNALPTVEGAILLALQALPVILDGTAVAVIGYGRIGSLLAERLTSFGARVTVYARNPRDLVHARLRHAASVRLQGEGQTSSLCELPRECRILFNTVPVPILTREVLSTLPRGIVLMELASAPGGIDLAAATAQGIQVLLASGLPGKLFPESAGKILALTVNELLGE